MIHIRPSILRLCTLLAFAAGATTGRAENDPPANHAPAAAPALSDAPVPPAPVPVTTAPESAPALAPVPAAPAVAASVPTPLPGISGPEAPAREPAAPAASPEPPAHTRLHAEGGREEIIGLQVLGTSLTERGDYEAAEIAFRQIMASRLANGDDLAHALLGLARVFRRQGSLTKAAAIYERFLKDYPADAQAPDALLELGRTHRALGAPQLALSRFYSVINSTLKLSAEGFDHYQLLAKTAQFEIAETHFQQGEYAEANKFFSRLRLLDLAPADRARAHFKSAYALYLGHDLEGAVSTLHSYLEQWPQDENVPEARYLLSLSLRTLGHKQEALEATLELLRSQQAAGDPKRWSYWQRRTGNQLANDFFQNGETHEALVIYQGLAALAPDPAWRLPITYQIGLCYERMRITERAIAAYQSIIDGTAAPAAPAPAPKLAGDDKPAPTRSEPPRPVSNELTELARMAAWRLTQLTWHDQTERQLTGIFSTAPEPAKPTPPPATAVAPNIESNAATYTPSLNDHPGKPATTPASL
jgi:TolA-binding protein